mmetsp:Transcript_15479/g.33415  ORF Transcript_15479/g.33415 Transcript_15479/m.33415 type:complete len:222 (-) Transcript_15479:288-953(-)
MVAGMDTDGPPFPTVTPTKESISSISVMAPVYIDGMTGESTTASFRRTNAMVKACLPGLMELCTTETLSMDNGKGTVNTPLPTEVNMKGLGKMDATMALELVPGKMVDAIGGNGEMVWPTDEVPRPILMAAFDTKANGSTTNPFVEGSRTSSNQKQPEANIQCCMRLLYERWTHSVSTRVPYGVLFLQKLHHVHAHRTRRNSVSTLHSVCSCLFLQSSLKR